METNPLPLYQQVQAKAAELGLWEDAIVCALDILSQNRNLINALDNKSEMDEYIYRAIIRKAMEKRRQQAEQNLDSEQAALRQGAERDLCILSREELFANPYYRAILPIIAKILGAEPFLRLHADEASEIIIRLADFKRRYRATTLTEIIVTRCREELQLFSFSADMAD